MFEPHSSINTSVSPNPSFLSVPVKPVSVKQTEHAPTAPAAPPSKATENQQQARNACLDLIRENPSFGILSQRLWGEIISPPPQRGTPPDPLQIIIQNKIQAFKQKKGYQDCINTLNRTSWKQHIATLKEGSPEWDLFAQFRAEAVELQNELSVLAANMMGMEHFHYSSNPKDKEDPEKNSWYAFGTPGNRSDIDNTLKSPKSSEEDKMLVKIFADTFYTYLFSTESPTESHTGSLSGIQLDTETYLEHPGSAQNTEARIADSSKGDLYYLELTMAQLEMRNAFGDDNAGWEQYKNSCYEFHEEPLKRSLEAIFTQVELFHAQVQIDILKEILTQMPEQTPEPTKTQITNTLATIERSYPPHDITSIRSSVEEIVKAAGHTSFDHAYKRAAMIYKCQRQMMLSRQMDEDHQELASIHIRGVPNQQQSEAADAIQIRLTAKALLRNAFFDESYLTSGAYNVICDREGGQLSKRRDEGILKQIEKARMSATLGLEAVISKVERNPATALDYVISVSENNAKFNHIAFPHDPEHTGDLQSKIRLAVDSSKYAERATSSSLAALDMMKKKLEHEVPNAQLNALVDIQNARDTISNLHEQATGLEKCKRQSELSDMATKKLLIDALWAQKVIFDRESEKQFEQRIDTVLNMFNPEGRYFNQEITPIDKYHLCLSQLFPEEYLIALQPDQETISHEDIVNALPDAMTTLQLTPSKIRVINSILQELILLNQQGNQRTIPAENGQTVLFKLAEQQLRYENPGRNISKEEIANQVIQLLIPFSQRVTNSPSLIWKKDLKKFLEYMRTKAEEITTQIKIRDFQSPIEVMMTSGMPEIDAIIRAKAGFSRLTDSEVQDLHTRARQADILQYSGLGSAEEIDNYLAGIKNISQTILKLTQSTLLIAAPIQTDNMNMNDLVRLWQATENQ